MRYLIVIALIVIAMIAGDAMRQRAHSEGYQWSCSSSYSRYSGRSTSSCSRITIPDPAPPTQEEIDAKKARIEKWEAFCKPEKRIDDLGVVRLVYAQKGCEFGRSE